MRPSMALAATENGEEVVVRVLAVMRQVGVEVGLVTEEEEIRR